MDRALHTRPDDLEEKEIDLVLEQLQENGFSSFFDHPDCPFSSIQEVDEALKELEKEFLKICSEKETKSHKNRCKSKAVVEPSSSTYNQPSFKNQKKIKESDNRFRFGLSENGCKKERLNKRIDSCVKPEGKSVDDPQISRGGNHETDVNKTLDLASGDTTEVCAVDSIGNKYSLKIEVLATVKLENNDNESMLRIQQCQSIPKVKAIKNSVGNAAAATKNPVSVGGKKDDKSVAGEDSEAYPPSLLNYRSSTSKPCPSSTNSTASVVKKNMILKAKPEQYLIKAGPEDLKLLKDNLCNKMCSDINQMIKSDLTVELSRDTLLPSQEHIFGQEVLVNYSVLEEQNNFGFIRSQSNLGKSLKSNCRSVQTSKPDMNNSFDNTVLRLNSLDDIEKSETTTCESSPLKLLSQEQQTSFHVLSTPSKYSTEPGSTIVASENCFKYDSIDESVNTSVLSMFNRPRLADDLSMSNSDESYLSEPFQRETSMSDCSAYREDSHVEQGCFNYNSKVKDKIINDETSSTSISKQYFEQDAIYVDTGIGSDIAVIPDSYEPEEDTYGDVDVSNEDVEYQTVPNIEAKESELDNKSDDIVTLESSSKETVIVRSSSSLLKNKQSLTTIKEESAGSTESETVDKSSSAVVFDQIDIGVGKSEEILIFVDKSSTLVDREVDCESEPPTHNREEIIEVDIRRQFVDKEVFMSNEAFADCSSLCMVDKEVRTSNVMIENKATMVDQEIDSEILKKKLGNSSRMVDKDIETVVESKSMCTFTDLTLKTWSDKGIAAGCSQHSIDLTIKTPSDLSWVGESSSERGSSRNEKRSDQRIGKLAGSKTLFAAKFKKLDPKAANSEKVTKSIRERREKRKSDENNSQKDPPAKRSKMQQDQIDRDSLNSASSAEQESHNSSGYHKTVELSENETKFVKGVFSRHGSTGKNKTAMKRRAFSNLDQKIIANRLAKSKKSMASKSSKKSVVENTKLNKRGTQPSDNSTFRGASSNAEYKLPDNTVIQFDK